MDHTLPRRFCRSLQRRQTGREHSLMAFPEKNHRSRIGGLVGLSLALTGYAYQPQATSSETSTIVAEAGLIGAKEAAKKVGQEVEFKDEIVAVSWSRTEKGRYLRFGAPYPRQVLSVWIPDALWAQLPEAPRVGRVALVQGEVITSPAGPLIRPRHPR